MQNPPVVYLIPTVLDSAGINALPAYIAESVKKCKTFYVEDERTTRRFFKSIWKEMVIDDYKWVTISKAVKSLKMEFLKDLEAHNPIGIVSEAGCPGIADPGQSLVAWAQEKKASLRPLVGPSSILLSLMASGFNGQQFCFNGYLPIENTERAQMIKELESRVQQKNITQIFIETPYRNNQLLAAILKCCSNNTLLCIAVNLTGNTESIQTKSVSDWKIDLPDLHKKPCIFLLGAG